MPQVAKNQRKQSINCSSGYGIAMTTKKKKIRNTRSAVLVAYQETYIIYIIPILLHHPKREKKNRITEIYIYIQ